MASSLLDRVKRPPPTSPDAFIAEAEKDVTPSALKQTPESAEQGMSADVAREPSLQPSTRKRRAVKDDPRKFEVPRYTFNLRLNDYELELLRALAEDRRESMQKIVKVGLIPYLEGLLAKKPD